MLLPLPSFNLLGSDHHMHIGPQSRLNTIWWCSKITKFFYNYKGNGRKCQEKKRNFEIDLFGIFLLPRVKRGIRYSLDKR
jgi:hypothetical protein